MSIIFWLAIAGAILAAVVGSGKKSTASKGKSTRIDHPHYFEEDDHECSVCGARFRGKGMICPKCGAKFTGTKEDDGEFMEEMVIWDEDD
ncbi:MAG: hypothetical protein IKZ98_02305 [Clostridia bacterium]|nr:hypothetical protein [Clostridia bacterium]